MLISKIFHDFAVSTRAKYEKMLSARSKRAVVFESAWDDLCHSATPKKLKRIVYCENLNPGLLNLTLLTGFLTRGDPENYLPGVSATLDSICQEDQGHLYNYMRAFSDEHVDDDNLFTNDILFVYCKLRVGCFVARVLTDDNEISRKALKCLDEFITPNLPPVNSRYHRISEGNPTIGNFIHWAITKRRYNVDYLREFVNLVHHLETFMKKIERSRPIPPQHQDYNHLIYRTAAGPWAMLEVDASDQI